MLSDLKTDCLQYSVCHQMRPPKKANSDSFTSSIISLYYVRTVCRLLAKCIGDILVTRQLWNLINLHRNKQFNMN